MAALIDIIDDDDAVRNSMHALLESYGYAVREHNSAEAFLALTETAADCLLVDQHMPGMTGLELLKQLRERGDQTPAFLITGCADASMETSAAALDVRVLHKPVDEDQLMPLIASTCRAVPSSLVKARESAQAVSSLYRTSGEQTRSAYMTLSETYRVSLPSVDEKHGKIIDVINQIHEALQASAHPGEVRKMFRCLALCSWRDFWHEETLFKGTTYPDASQHTRKHEHLMAVLSCFQHGADRMGRPMTYEDQLGFVRDWLLDHIANEDQQLANYLKTPR